MVGPVVAKHLEAICAALADLVPNLVVTNVNEFPQAGDAHALTGAVDLAARGRHFGGYRPLADDRTLALVDQLMDRLYHMVPPLHLRVIIETKGVGSLLVDHFHVGREPDIHPEDPRAILCVWPSSSTRSLGLADYSSIIRITKRLET